MNENTLVELMEKIGKEFGVILKSKTDNIPLVSSTIYDLIGDELSLHVKITKAADMSALNKNITFRLQISNLLFEPFSIVANKNIFGFLTNKTKYDIEGIKNQEVVHFLIAELKKKQMSGIRMLKIKSSNKIFKMQFKTTYLESLESALSISHQFIRKFVSVNESR
jgi:hypothetical protein